MVECVNIVLSDNNRYQFNLNKLAPPFLFFNSREAEYTIKVTCVYLQVKKIQLEIVSILSINTNFDATYIFYSFHKNSYHQCNQIFIFPL